MRLSVVVMLHGRNIIHKLQMSAVFCVSNSTKTGSLRETYFCFVIKQL